MKAINRLNEIASMDKYSKYIQDLIDKVNEALNISLQPKMAIDKYTYLYGTLVDPDGKYMTCSLKFTTNRIELKGICWATFIIAGRKYEIGELFGDLTTDCDIIEDSYYDFYEQAEMKNIKLPRY